MTIFEAFFIAIAKKSVFLKLKSSRKSKTASLSQQDVFGNDFLLAIWQVIHKSTISTENGYILEFSDAMEKSKTAEKLAIIEQSLRAYHLRKNRP